MAKTYDEEKHFDLSYCLAKGQAFFDNLDFSKAGTEAVEKILKSGVPDIEFYECVFTDLDLAHSDENIIEYGTPYTQPFEEPFKSKISFSKCLFKGNTDFSYKKFNKFTSFRGSEFNGITKFNNTVFNDGAEFDSIHTKPAKGGYFYYRGDEIDYSHYNKYYENYLSFTRAKFETEVSFFGRKFYENTTFMGATFYNKFWFSECSVGLKTNFQMRFECDGIKDIDMCYRILKGVLAKEYYEIQARAIAVLEEKMLAKQHKVDVLAEEDELDIPNRHDAQLLTTQEAADYLGLKLNTLERWRSQEPNKLPFVKIGRTVKYRLEDLQKFITKNVN